MHVLFDFERLLGSEAKILEIFIYSISKLKKSIAIALFVSKDEDEQHQLKLTALFCRSISDIFVPH